LRHSMVAIQTLSLTGHQHCVFVKPKATVKETTPQPCDPTAMDWANPSAECLAPVPAPKRVNGEPDSFIPSVFTRAAFAPACKDVKDLDLGTYTGDEKILVYGTSKWLVPTTTLEGVAKLFNTGHHTTEILLPMYHFARAGFTFDFVTMDGGSMTLEEWTYPMAYGYEDLLRQTGVQYKEAMDHPLKASAVRKDLSGYKAIFIPGGHGPLAEEHLDADFGALLRTAHGMSLPVMSLCHGPNAFRSAALGGEFPFKGYETKVFPDASDQMTPSIGYLPGYLNEEDHAEQKLKDLGMTIMSEALDDTVHQDRELVTGTSNLAAQKFSELALTVLLNQPR